MDATTSAGTRFDIIPYQDLSPEPTWTRLGKGSFGSVYKGEYLGLTVAIKEVMESGEYDVEKYFARECKIMQEARHPNIVQYIGLSLAPLPAGSGVSNGTKGGRTRQRILIISEFLPHGNLRTYLLSPSSTHPLSWRLRLSFATDVARAVAYLHARKCLHRDLKGENLLITENDRIKVCDFGFARLAARDEAEMRRMSYCGTDGYMSPEILMGLPFSLPTDIFSLGMIFAEIISRTLVDGDIFLRPAPHFTIAPAELIQRASEGCPNDLIALCLGCVATAAEDRPLIGEVLTRLREIEREVVGREAAVGGNSGHVGSVKFATARRRTTASSRPVSYGPDSEHETSSSDEEEAEALASLEISVPTLRPRTAGEIRGEGGYATSVIRQSSMISSGSRADLTLRVGDGSATSSLPTIPSAWLMPPPSAKTPAVYEAATVRTEIPSEIGTIRSFLSDDVSIAAATVDGGASVFSGFTDAIHGGDAREQVAADAVVPEADEVYFDAASRIVSAGLMHRFSIVKPGWARAMSTTSSELQVLRAISTHATPGNGVGLWGSAWSRCGVCEKRLGLGRVYLACDDCGVKCHIKCSDATDANCTGGEFLPHNSAHLSEASLAVRENMRASSGGGEVRRLRKANVLAPPMPSRRPPAIPAGIA